MLPVTIRAIDLHDEDSVDEIETLDRLAFGTLANPLRAESGHWWLARSGGVAVAFGGYMPARSHPGLAYFNRSGVLPDFRGQGLQRRLIRVREIDARRRGFVGAVTDTTDNLASANSLIRCGFRLFEPKHPWAFSNSLYWRKAF